MKRKWTPGRIVLGTFGGYLIANVVFFFLDPFSSPWHYHDHEPVPIAVERKGDINLSLAQMTTILDEIDLAYSGRQPTQSEQIGQSVKKAVLIFLLPASIALNFKEFIGYIGPANREQQAFTLSVKRRYNHLVRLAIAKGMERDGYLFVQDIRRKNKMVCRSKTCANVWQTPTSLILQIRASKNPGFSETDIPMTFRNGRCWP
jgi:hypothetical protein